MNITAVIILYNSDIKSSETIQSLLNTQKKNINLNIIIWNNGPKQLEINECKEFESIFNKQNVQISIYENTNNIALSKIYNFFIIKENFDFFSILDQDSILASDFFQNILLNNTFDIIIPFIYSANWRTKEKSLCYPIYAQSEKLLDKATFEMGEIESIASGLTISHKLINYLFQTKTQIFNESYALYAIDTCFFIDLKKLNNTNFKGLCIGKINHSLNFNLHNKAQISPTRKLEMDYSKILNKLLYENKTSIKVLLYILRKFVRKEYSLNVFLKLSRCLIAKKHPRCYKPIKARRLL